MNKQLLRLIFLLFLTFVSGATIWSQSEDWTPETLRSNIKGAWTRSADFDQDGDPDILLQAGDSVYWYENLRPGWIPHLIDATFFNSDYGYVDIVDMDGDGDFDVLQVNGQGNGTDVMSWDENQMKGATWVKHFITIPTYLALWLQNACGDLDGDNDKDMVVAEANFAGKGSLYWLEHIPVQDVWLKHLLDTTQSWFSSLGDMDGDGDLDIISASTGVFWLENQLPSLTWTRHTIVGSTANEYFIGTSADLNGDNKPDIVTGPSGSHGAISYFGSPDFQETTIHPDNNFYYMGPQGDVDGDGDTDVLYGGNGFVVQPLGWAESLNNGESWTLHDITTPTILQQIPTGVADIDGDGDMDIISLTFDVTSALGSAVWYANPEILTGVSIQPDPLDFAISVFPNPTKEQFCVKIEGDFQEQCILILTDPDGKMLLEKNVAREKIIPIDIKDLPAGVYWVRVMDKNREAVKRVVKK